MKIVGYNLDDSLATTRGPHELAEVTLIATPTELRRIAAFLSDAATAMERMGPIYDHEHLCDRQPGFDDSPQLVVVNADLLAR